MNKTPWLSVVVPVFLAERSITRAISSITDQGVDGVEIVCVDDCSPDSSAEVIEDLRHRYPTLRLIRQAENLGPGPARNAGIDAAAGAYVLFLDSDDTLIDGGLAALRDTITATASDLILVGCEEVRRGKVRSLTDGPLWDLFRHNQKSSTEEEPRVLFWPPAPWSKVYRREFLNQRGLRLGLGVAQDIPWSAGATLTATSFALCRVPVYRYVTGTKDSSITTTKSAKNLIRLDQVRAIRENHDVATLPAHVAEHLSALAAIHLIWSNRAAYRLLPDDSHEDFFYRTAEEITAWTKLSPISPTLDTRPLMSALDRNMYFRLLSSGNWNRWQGALRRQGRKKVLRRLLQPAKVFGKK